MAARIEPILWARAENDYVTGDDSLIVIAARHGLNQNTVINRAIRYKWTDLRRDYRFEKREKLANVRSEIAPVELPPQILELQNKKAPELGPEFWTEQNSRYYLNGFAKLDALDDMLKEKLKGAADMEPKDFNALVSANDTLMERRMIMLSIPRVAAVKREMKAVKKKLGAVTIDD